MSMVMLLVNFKINTNGWLHLLRMMIKSESGKPLVINDVSIELFFLLICANLSDFIPI
jgi:hypothetical protein